MQFRRLVPQWIVTANSDSNAAGSKHLATHSSKDCAAAHNRCRTVKDRLGVKGSQVQILSSRPTPGPLTLDKTPRQRAFFVQRVDHSRVDTVESCGPFMDLSD